MVRWPPRPAAAVEELSAAVAATLDNTARHGGPGAQAWLVVEQEPDAVLVTVRDDGVGMLPGRVDEATVQGRLGLAASVLGRLAALGGRASVDTAPGRGVEVELRLPTDAAPGGPA